MAREGQWKRQCEGIIRLCWCRMFSGVGEVIEKRRQKKKEERGPVCVCGRACACNADSRQIWRGPTQTPRRLGERWREARTEHETDRKQIGPEPVAINHHRRARPSHNSHMHVTHRRTFTHTNMHSRKWNVATRVKSPTANTPGNRREKNHSSYFYYPPTQFLSLKQPWLLELRQDKRHNHTIPNTHVHKCVIQWGLVRVKGELAFIMKNYKGDRAISEQCVTHSPTFLHCVT